MALSYTILFPAVQSSFSGIGFTGVALLNLCHAITSGIIDALINTASVTTYDQGSLGVGSGQGFITPDPVKIKTSLSQSMAGSQINGVATELIVDAMSSSIASALTFAEVKTTHSSVGTGFGLGTISPSSSSSVFYYAFLGAGFSTDLSASLAASVSTGFDACLPFQSVQVVISGSASPSGASGVGSGMLL